MLILETASTSSLEGGVSLSTTSVAALGSFGAVVNLTNGEGVLDFCTMIKIIIFIAAAGMPSCNSPSWVALDL